MSDEHEHTPPHNADAEAAVIGSVFLDRDAWREVRELVNENSFADEANATIWRAISAMHDRGRPVDAVTVRECLNQRGELAGIGGVAYLAAVIQSTPSSSHAMHYAGIVADLARKREALRIAHNAIRAVYSPSMADEPGATILQRMADAAAVASQSSVASGARRIGEVVSETLDSFGEGGIETIETGLRTLDEIIRGIAIGEMVIVGARPSMGKSTLCRQVLINAMLRGVPTALVSLEEGQGKIARNVLANLGRVDNYKLRKVEALNTDDWSRINEAAGRVFDAPGWVIDTKFRLDQIHAELSLLKARHGIKFVMIDYLQRVRAPGKDRYEQVSNASLGISQMLKELKLAGLVPVQLNRALEQRDDKRPMISDLRDSGQIEQDADGILFLHREDYYHLDDDQYQPSGEAELIIAKWRDGVRGKTAKLKSMLNFQAFDAPDVPNFL